MYDVKIWYLCSWQVGSFSVISDNDEVLKEEQLEPEFKLP